MRNVVLDNGVRLDGRKPGHPPHLVRGGRAARNHGSAVFTRGETQAINMLTGQLLDEQTIDLATRKGSENFLLHYNFPPFSTGEVRPIQRRRPPEVGHGTWPSALKPVIQGEPTLHHPPEPRHPGPQRLSSMATVCSGTWP